MKGNVNQLRNRIYELSIRIEEERYNSNTSRSELKKLTKQKNKLEKQLLKLENRTGA